MTEEEKNAKAAELLPPKLLAIYNKFSHKQTASIMMRIKMSLTKELVLRKLKETRGHVAKACEYAKISRRTFNNYMLDDPMFYEYAQEITERRLDDAEEKLLQNIDSRFEASIIFFLKTQGKNRGYSEQDQGDLDQKRLARDASRMGDDALERELREIRESLGLNPNQSATDAALDPHYEKPNDTILNKQSTEFQDQFEQDLRKERGDEDFGIDSIFEDEDDRLKYLKILEDENKDMEFEKLASKLEENQSDQNGITLVNK